MDRPITVFSLDAAGDWMATLTCGHHQHVRHKPPFENRPWVTTAAGRESRLGATLNCVRCDRFELPEGADFVRRTPEFTERTVPEALRSHHATAVGVWGRIVVTEGVVRYQVPSLGVDRDLSPGTTGIVLPEVPHSIEPRGAVRFHVEFLRPHDVAPSSRKQ
jgi:tellurite methyltransferase